MKEQEQKQFDPTKPVQTRSGRKAGIYSTNNGGDYPIHGWYRSEKGYNHPRAWGAGGRFYPSGMGGVDSLDLVNIPEEPTTIEGWLETIEDEKLRSLAFDYCHGYHHSSLCDKMGNFKDALLAAFVWNKTKEGHTFWDKVAEGEVTTLPEPTPYTLETFPDSFIMMRPKGKSFRWAIGSTSSMGVTPVCGNIRLWEDLKGYEFSSGDGVWQGIV